MRKLVAVFVAALTFVACQPTARRFKGPDGNDAWFAVKCQGRQSDCWELAGKLCLYGYHLMDEQGHEELRAATMPNGQIIATSKHHGELLIRCKDAPASPTIAGQEAD